jgi:hypothetical protein
MNNKYSGQTKFSKKKRAIIKRKIRHNAIDDALYDEIAQYLIKNATKLTKQGSESIRLSQD